MKLERKNGSGEESDSDFSCDQFERPEEWERVSIDDLPDADFDQYPLPDPEDQERIRAEDHYES